MNRKLMHNSALCTDFYQLTMAYSYFKEGIADEEACFHIFFRKAPFGGEFTIAAGLDVVIKYISEYKFRKTEIEYLATLRDSKNNKYFSSDFLDFLEAMQLSIDIDAVPEGVPVFANEPMLRIKGPIAQCQLLETPLLNILNFQSLIATKAARICLAAGNSQVVDFGLRRAQGFDGALSATRAAIVGGCKSSSNVFAGYELGIPVSGTLAHSFVMRFEKEEDAFLSFAKAMPSNSILLVDTYHTIEGVKKACQIGQWLKAQGQELMGIRLDSGDLCSLSKEARRILDEAGFKNAIIVASNELDEYHIKSLKMADAPIDVFGVGTRLITAFEEPALGGVYKLAAIRQPGKDWQYRIKISDDEAKSTLPGILQVKRFLRNGEFYKDIIFDESLRSPLKDENSYNLLEPIFRQGSLVYKPPALMDIQQRTKAELEKMPKHVADLEHPKEFCVEIEKGASRTQRSNEKRIYTKMISSLLVVDMQNDFMPNGALPVPSASTLVPIINILMIKSELVLASLDWHPPHHASFVSEYPGKSVGDMVSLENNQQVLWPEHCVANSPGAELVSGLKTDLINNYIYKGNDQNIDSYSAFFDNNKQRSTELDKILKSHKIKKIFICGVALEYCVCFSAIDAAELGYETYLILDACKGVELNKGDIQNALMKMINADVKITTMNNMQRFLL